MAERWKDGVVVDKPGVASGGALWFATRVLYPTVRLLHRATVDGLEHLPPTGPYLLVANHSGGLGLAEINSFMALYATRFGGSRPIAGFAHSFGFRVWPLSWIHPHLGTIPSSYTAAEKAISKGVPILVFPGGDHEALRPIWQAHRVDFGGRKGFLRIAHRAHLSIVPMGIRGSHFTSMPLVRSRLFTYLAVWPALIGIKRYAVTLSAILGAMAILMFVPLAWPWRGVLAWMWAALPFTFVPWIPWTIRMRIGPPLTPATLFGPSGAVTDASRDPDDEILTAALHRVESEIQSLVDRPR